MRINKGIFRDIHNLGQDSLYSTPPIDIRSNTEVQDEVTFTLSPNPTSGRSILLASDPEFSGYIQVFDTRGVLLHMEPFTKECLINTDSKSGVFYIRILDATLKMIATKQLIRIKN